MKSKTFRGKDATDVEQQIWAWRNDNPQISITKIYPIEKLPLLAIKSEKYAPLTAPDTVSKKIEYEDSI